MKVLMKENREKKLFSDIIKIQKDKKDLIEKLIHENINKNWNTKRLPIILHSIIIAAISEMILSPKLSIGIVATEYLKITECFFIEGESAFVNAIIEKVHSILISSKKVLMDNEFKIIKDFFLQLVDSKKSMKLSNDGALLNLRNTFLTVSTDMMIEGTHFNGSETQR